jgi:adenylylsulfate reductase subunit A
MTVGMAGLWACQNVRPEEKPSEVMPTEPYLLGSHSGCGGLWVSGPEDIAPPEWVWGHNGVNYNRMTTVIGLFTSGDGVGASGHKFSSGAHSEGRIAGKNMVKFVQNNKDFKPELKESAQEIADLIYRPFATYEEHKNYSSDPEINPNYIKPRMYQFRLMKIMDEYVAGTSTFYMTSGPMMNRALELLKMLKEDGEKLAARDLHELLRAWENYHRVWTAEAHLRGILFREESRYPGFYYRMDFPLVDEDNWKCFVNSTYDVEKDEYNMKKVPHKDIVPKK